MSHPRLENVNIESVVPLATPREMKAAIPLTAATIGTVARGRETIEHILDGDDPRLFAVVGPCSIHNLQAAEEYAHKLKVLAGSEAAMGAWTAEIPPEASAERLREAIASIPEETP